MTAIAKCLHFAKKIHVYFCVLFLLFVFFVLLLDYLTYLLISSDSVSPMKKYWMCEWCFFHMYKICYTGQHLPIKSVCSVGIIWKFFTYSVPNLVFTWKGHLRIIFWMNSNRPYEIIILCICKWKNASIEVMTSHEIKEIGNLIYL